MHESAALWCQVMGCQLWVSDCTLQTRMRARARTLGHDIWPLHLKFTKTCDEMTQKPKNCGAQMPFGAHLPHSTTSVLPSALSPTTSCYSLLSSQQKKNSPDLHHRVPCPPHPATPNQLHHPLHSHHTLCNYETPLQIGPIVDPVFCPSTISPVQHFPNSSR